MDKGAALLYLSPFPIRAIDGSDQLRIVEVKEIRAAANDGAILVMQFLDFLGVASRPHQSEPPQVGVP